MGYTQGGSDTNVVAQQKPCTCFIFSVTMNYTGCSLYETGHLCGFVISVWAILFPFLEDTWYHLIDLFKNHCHFVLDHSCCNSSESMVINGILEVPSVQNRTLM